ncbi:hypothetical protein EON63_19320 [archaeon]|nr:MAG: hypothetical protein EON63_19320 [archaeon]
MVHGVWIPPFTSCFVPYPLHSCALSCQAVLDTFDHMGAIIFSLECNSAKEVTGWFLTYSSLRGGVCVGMVYVSICM